MVKIYNHLWCEEDKLIRYRAGEIGNIRWGIASTPFFISIVIIKVSLNMSTKFFISVFFSAYVILSEVK